MSRVAVNQTWSGTHRIGPRHWRKTGWLKMWGSGPGVLEGSEDLVAGFVVVVAAVSWWWLVVVVVEERIRIDLEAWASSAAASLSRLRETLVFRCRSTWGSPARRALDQQLCFPVPGRPQLTIGLRVPSRGQFVLCQRKVFHRNGRDRAVHRSFQLPAPDTNQRHHPNDELGWPWEDAGHRMQPSRRDIPQRAGRGRRWRAGKSRAVCVRH